MLQGVIVLFVIAFALLRGGSLRNFAAVRLRALPLVFGSLAIQLLIFTPFRSGEPLVPLATGALYLLSMGLLVVWVALNRDVSGMVLIGAGVLLNTAAIAANGGYMPVDPLAAMYAGRIERYAADGLPVANNSIATAENVQLWLLTDIFPVHGSIPLANVHSIGDILLTIGISIFCYTVIRGHGRPQPAVAPPALPTTPEPVESAP